MSKDPHWRLILALGLGIPLLSGCDHAAPIAAPLSQSERDHGGLIEVTKAGDLNTVSTLLAEGVNPNTVVNTNTALTFAARDGQLEIAEVLIAYGADVNWIDGEGVTPLILAVFKNHVEVVKLLLENGADPMIRDQWQRRAIDYALRRGESDEIVQLLRAVRSSQSKNSLVDML